jgi:cobalt-zinc-cadmium efflux system membrane fusion protein
MQTGHRRSGLARSVIVFAAIGLGFAALAAYLTNGFGLLERSKTAAPEQPWLVRSGDKILVPEGSPLRDRLAVAPAASEPINPKLVFPGVVEADPARTASVLAPLGGRLRELKVSLGDRVAKDQLVAIIDSPDLAQAFDDDEKAKAAVELTEKNLRRQQGLFKTKAASEIAVEQAANDYAQATAENRRTQARLKVLGAASQVQRADRLLAVKAPVGGSVTTLSVAPGNMINDPTQPLMTISDLSTVWVTALVSEKDVSLVAKDQDAEVVLAARPEETLRGQVLFVSDVMEADTRRNKLRIAFSNVEYTLKPNMFATVTVLGPRKPRVVVPTSALLMNNDRTTVFVATAPWTFERRIVAPQLDEGSSVTIDSGLTAGERIVVKGGILLND